MLLSSCAQDLIGGSGYHVMFALYTVWQEKNLGTFKNVREEVKYISNVILLL